MEEKIKDIVVKVNGDTTGLEKALKSVIKQSTNLQSELRKVDRLLKLDPANTQLLEQKQKLLGQSIENTKEKLNTLKDAEKQVQDQFKQGNGEEQYRALQREIVNTELNLKSLESKAKDVGTTTIASLEQVSKKTGDFSEKVASVGNSFMPATKAITEVGTVATQAAIDFESSFAEVIGSVDATDAQLVELKDGIRDMAKEIPTSATEIAGIAEAAGRLGIETPNVLSFTRTIADLGATTNLSGEEAAASIAKFANITQMSQGDFDRLGSTIVALGNDLKVSESDMVTMSMGLANAGTQAGMTEAEILSFSGALSSVGIEAEAGGSAFSKVIEEMQLAAESGGAKLENFATVAGMSADEFASKFKTNASGALTDFITGLGKTEEKGLSAIQVLDDMGISEASMADTLLKAAGAGDILSSSIDIGTNAWKENTALANEAERKYSMSAAQIDIAKSAINDFAITIGDIILPVIMDLIEGLKSVVEWFSSLSPETQKTIVIIAAVVAAIAPLLLLIGGVASGISALSAAMAFLISPIGLIIVAIAALVAGLIYLWNTNEGLRNIFIDCWNEIIESMQRAGEWLTILFTEIIPGVFSSLIEWIASVFTTDWTTQFGMLGNIINAFMQNVSNIWEAIKAIFNGIIDFIKNVFTGNWQGAWDAVKDIFKGIFELLISYAKAPLNAIIGMLNAAIDGINTLIKGLNKIHFDIPDWVPGLGGKSFGINIPMVGKIPMLAKGGVLSSGSAIVGEAGPELLSMINGKAVVIPLTNQQRQSTGRMINQTNNFYNYKTRDGAAAVRDLNRQLGEAY